MSSFHDVQCFCVFQDSDVVADVVLSKDIRTVGAHYECRYVYIYDVSIDMPRFSGEGGRLDVPRATDDVRCLVLGCARTVRVLRCCSAAEVCRRRSFLVCRRRSFFVWHINSPEDTSNRSFVLREFFAANGKKITSRALRHISSMYIVRIHTNVSHASDRLAVRPKFSAKEDVC